MGLSVILTNVTINTFFIMNFEVTRKNTGNCYESVFIIHNNLHFASCAFLIPRWLQFYSSRDFITGYSFKRQF